MLRAYAKKRALLGASFGGYDDGGRGGGLNGETLGPQGLVAGHAYSVSGANGTRETGPRPSGTAEPDVLVA